MAELPIGTLLESEDHPPAHLLAQRLNRHTFWCGQSGSGKTYALGVLLEQVLLHTRLPVVILDPNSDFVKLGEVREDAPTEARSELESRDIRVFGARNGRPLKARLLDMPLRSQAAVVDLDPILDAEEYNAMLNVAAEVPTIRQGHLIPFLRESDKEIRHRLAMRSRTWASPTGPSGHGATAPSRKTSTTGPMRPSSTSAASRPRPSRARPRSPCSTTSGRIGRTGSAASSSSTRRTTSAPPTR